jgi:hypothetical protein
MELYVDRWGKPIGEQRVYVGVACKTRDEVMCGSSSAVTARMNGTCTDGKTSEPSEGSIYHS